MGLALQVGQILPYDKRVCTLLVLFKLNDLLNNRGNALLTEEYLPGIDSSRVSLYGWVSRNCQGWEAQIPDRLRNVHPTLILPLDVIGYGIDCLLLFDCIFCISDVVGVAFKSQNPL